MLVNAFGIAAVGSARCGGKVLAGILPRGLRPHGEAAPPLPDATLFYPRRSNYAPLTMGAGIVVPRLSPIWSSGSFVEGIFTALFKLGPLAGPLSDSSCHIKRGKVNLRASTSARPRGNHAGAGMQWVDPSTR